MTVGDLLLLIAPRLAGKTPAMPLVDAINSAALLIFKRLVSLQSDLVAEEFTLDYVRRAEPAEASLPAGFHGLRGKPRVQGETIDLEPLQGSPAQYSGQPGTPTHYRLRGATLIIYPAPDTSIFVVGEAYVRPPAVAVPADDLPFSEMFDDLLREATTRLLVGTMAVDREFEAYLFAQVDMVMPERDSNLPQQRPVRYF
jgi:hypothetical protein